MNPLAFAELPSSLLGIYQILKGNSELSKLHKQAVPRFGETSEQAASRARAEQLASGGFTPQEKAGFRKNIAEDINTQSQKALDLGGGQLGKVIAGMGKINEMSGEANFATKDADLHRQNIHYADKFSAELQRISDMNIQKQLQQRMMAEQALGGAIKTGTENLVGGLSGGLALGLGTEKGTGGYNGAGAGSTNATGSAMAGWGASSLNRFLAPNQKDTLMSQEDLYKAPSLRSNYGALGEPPSNASLGYDYGTAVDSGMNDGYDPLQLVKMFSKMKGGLR